MERSLAWMSRYTRLNTIFDRRGRTSSPLPRPPSSSSCPAPGAPCAPANQRLTSIKQFLRHGFALPRRGSGRLQAPTSVHHPAQPGHHPVSAIAPARGLSFSGTARTSQVTWRRICLVELAESSFLRPVRRCIPITASCDRHRAEAWRTALTGSPSISRIFSIGSWSPSR